MIAKNIDRRINQIELMSRALAGMRLSADVPTMSRGVIDYLAPFAHLCGEHDAVSFLVEAMQAEAEDLLSKQVESDNKRIAELEAENDRLKAEITEHEWWGGGGR